MSTSDPLTVESSVHGNAVVLSARGEIDMGTAPILRHQLEDALVGAGKAAVLVDLTEVDFLASAGLALLAEYHTRCREQGRALRVLTDGGPVLRAIRISALDQVLDLHPSLAAALAAG
ncbi:STAS domain-containing protein [Actinokineospora iranica]|uniref:Anti-sigma factor antagonist n=1 Tax=Actinokineospora iranica TaxID=1271860 RepID=A0A1G6K1P1_9PSEU|nr:STAS domain-containing protein [Actinokineospora iranica]SDC24808.1 anti-anti-sigma factor [Actinokineospora iranica]